MDLLITDNSSHLLSAALMSLVNFIVINYFSEFYTVCVIKTPLDDILLNVPIPSVVLTVDANFNETFQTAVDDGCQAFIVSERALFTFLDAFVEIHDVSDQRSASKRLMVVMDSNDQSLMDGIAKHPNIVELPNVLIVVQDTADTSIALYTTKISNNGTRSTKTVDIEPVYESDYFPDKFSNMNGVPIHFYTLMYPPYVYYEETVPEKANARYRASFKEDNPLFMDGTEANLILEYCRKYNCSVEATFDETDLWGEVFDNHTGYGLLGSVVEHRADISMAAIYFWHQPYKFATYTHPISRSGVSVLVPKPRILPPWRTPFLSFSVSLWAAVFVAFCIGVLAVWSVENVRYKILQPDESPVTLSDSVLTMIGFFMEQNSRVRTDLISCVMLFTSLLFAGFMVGNCYGCGLAGIMTIPQYEKAIDSSVDLADNGMIWATNALSWIFSLLNAPQPHLKKLVTTYRVISEEVLAKHTKTHDMGFGGERTEFQHFVPADFVDSEASTMLKLLKDDLYWESVTALVAKTCPFKQKLNDLIMQVKQSGIQNYWELQASNHYLHSTVQLNILNARSSGSGESVVKLTVSHFLGAYMILAVGTGSAFLVFLLEIFRSRMTRLEQIWKKNLRKKLYLSHDT